MLARQDVAPVFLTGIEEKEVLGKSFWETVEKNIILRLFSKRKLADFNIQPTYSYWAPYIGEESRVSDEILNSEHREKQNIQNESEQLNETAEITQERVLEMLSGEKYADVAKTAKMCGVETKGSKMDIILRIKSTIASNTDKCND